MEVVKELFDMLGPEFSPTTDVTSRISDSSPCLTRYPIGKTLQTNLEGQRIYAHPEEKDIVPLLEHYLECKNACPETTSGMFILPAKSGTSRKWLKYLTGMELIKIYSGRDRPLRKGSDGTRPYSPQIEVWYDGPEEVIPGQMQIAHLQLVRAGVHKDPANEANSGGADEQVNDTEERPAEAEKAEVRMRKRGITFGVRRDNNTPAFLFKARSGTNSLITLIDSGASECIITE